MHFVLASIAATTCYVPVKLMAIYADELSRYTKSAEEPISLGRHGSLFSLPLHYKPRRDGGRFRCCMPVRQLATRTPTLTIIHGETG